MYNAPPSPTPLAGSDDFPLTFKYYNQVRVMFLFNLLSQSTVPNNIKN